jgi:arylsulfatase A-like enzyme
MLIRFDSKAGGFSTFGDVAVTLLKMMGHSGPVPGAILAKDIPPALDKLRSAVAAAPEPPVEQGSGKHADKEPPVSIRQRAFPLIELLERAARDGCDVLWDRA